CWTANRHFQNALLAYNALGDALFFLGELSSARVQFEQGITLYDPHQHRPHAFRYGQDAGVVCSSMGAWTLFILGYPDQALKQLHAAFSLAQEVAHTFSLALVLMWIAELYQFSW